MKQKLLILLAAIMTAVSAHAFSYTYEDQTLYYTKTSDTTCEVSSCKANTKNGTYIIPETLTYNDVEYTVTGIAASAFSGSATLETLVIPETVVSIGESAFSGCSGLTTINIPQSITAIETRTFYGCSSLETIVIPDAVETIGEQVFTNCNSLRGFYGKFASEDNRCLIVYDFLKAFAPLGLTSYNIPSSVWSIGKYAFDSCKDLNTVVIPNSVVAIGDHAFQNCEGLISIAIPNSVEDIGFEAFYQCSNLVSVEIPSSVTRIQDAAFESCTSLKSVIIPGSVTYVGSSAFSRCNSLKSVVIEDGVKSIGRTVFHDCKSLTSVTLPNSITKINSGDFWGCSSLSSFVLPESITSIESCAFQDCVSLSSIIIPESVTEIGSFAFYGCINLTSINIPESVSSIQSSAFQDCSSLCSIIVPDGVRTLSERIFYGCTGLSTVEIPESVTLIGKEAFSGCVSLKCLDIPENVSNIGESAFAGCSGLTNIKIPDLVTSIEYGTFINCSGLTSMELPESTTSLGINAFYGCNSLVSISIPESITNIGNWAFHYCDNLEKIKVEVRDPSEIALGYHVFEGVDTDHCYLFVPKGSEELYAEADQWKDFMKINYRVINDGEAYQAEEDAEEPNVDYIRKFGNTKWQALYLPFAMNYDEWSPYADVAELYNIRGYDTDDDGTIDEVRVEFNRLKEGSSIKPNVPYVIKAKETGKVTFECKDKVVLAAPEEEGVVECSSTKFTYAFHGIYEEKTDVFDTGVYFLSGGNFVQAADETVKLAPYRAYLTITQKKGGYNDDSTPAPAPKRIVLVVDAEEETTGIDDIQITAPQDDIYYDLTGRRVTNPTSGIYIQNGRKVYIK